MAKNDLLAVKDAVHRVQLCLLEGIEHERLLIAAGSLISRDNYCDVVTERTIAKTCGYPLCGNSIPSQRPRRGRYRISLKEHKVFDLQETYMYCSTKCLIDSRAFAASLQPTSSALNPAKLNQLVNLFEGVRSDSDVDMGKNGDLGMSELKIQEKMEVGGVSMEEWIGPANAIEGYVPLRDKNPKARQFKNDNKGGKQDKVGTRHRFGDPNVQDIMSHDMNFTSTIIFHDEYSVSKTVTPVKAKEPKGNLTSKDVNRVNKPIKKSGKYENATVTDDKVNVSEDIAGPSQKHDTRGVKNHHDGKESATGDTVLKSSLKTSDSKKAICSVTWADEKTDFDGQDLEECEELECEEGALLTPHLVVEDVGEEGALVTPHSVVEEVGEEELYRFESAEACARALSQAAEAVALGKSDASNAVSEAGVIILPPSHGVDAANSEEMADGLDTNPVQLKWPPKPGFSGSELFDSEDSLYDSPPEGFNLTLSPFSRMFMALFAWISSSSLAYIYGKEESFHEEYLSVNGREYPRRIVIPDGRSSEIKQSLAVNLARALPTLVAELRLPVPISSLEKPMGHLTNTMSFVDPLPSLRMKQWQVIVLLFLDALSVSRIPSLTQYLLGNRVLIPKILEGAQISSEEYGIMKDLIIPLGRAPQFSTQSGG